MPIAWFIVPYALRPDDGRGAIRRYVAMDDFTEQIMADPEYGGKEPWREFEILGNHAFVKVRASAALLSTINAVPGVVRIPNRFTDPDAVLGDLTAGERTAIINKLNSLGFTNAQISAGMGGTVGAWRSRTLRDIFRLARSRYRRPIQNPDGTLGFESQDAPEGPPGSMADAEQAVI